MKSIPVIDLGNIAAIPENPSKDPEWVSTAEKVRNGLGAVGFLYLTNHGIPKELISHVFSQSQKFFDLPSSVKLNYKKDTSVKGKTFEADDYFGYTQPGDENLHPTSTYEARETYDWLDNGRGIYPTAEVPDFESSVVALDKECKLLMKKLLRLLAIGLKVEDVNIFVKCCNHFEDPKNYKGIYNMRLLHYPPIEDNFEANPGTVRCGEHSDYGFLTLLFQDDVGGLEVKTVDGDWIHAEPIEGSILVNTGDLTEFWTCGIFPATPHRIIIPADVSDPKRRKSRYSVAFFNGPDKDAIVKPMDMEKRPCELDRLAKNGRVYSKDSVVAYDYMMGRIAAQYT